MLITAKKARLLTEQTYSIVTKEEIYNSLENTIIECIKQGKYECYFVIPENCYLSQKDAKAIKRTLKQLGYKFVQYNSDTIQTFSFSW